jgi:hypothetical protein
MQATEPQSPPTTTLTYPEKLLGYTEESKAHFKRSKYTDKYLSRKATASLNSPKTYATHLAAFAFYIYKRKGQEVDAFIDSIKAGQNDAYNILAEFAGKIGHTIVSAFKYRVSRSFVKPSRCTYTRNPF